MSALPAHDRSSAARPRVATLWPLLSALIGLCVWGSLAVSARPVGGYTMPPISERILWFEANILGGYQDGVEPWLLASFGGRLLVLMRRPLDSAPPRRCRRSLRCFDHVAFGRAFDVILLRAPSPLPSDEQRFPWRLRFASAPWFVYEPMRPVSAQGGSDGSRGRRIRP